MRVLTLVVLILAYVLPLSAADVIRVSASCPGADASTLDLTVLMPIFEQIKGLDELIRVETEARNDGTGTLSVYFDPKADISFAEIRVQNRVSLALPLLPDSCRRLGISVRKIPSGPPQFWLALTSTDPDQDEAFLGRFAIVNIKPECAGLPGVVDVRVLGGKDYRLQILLNPHSLAACKLTASDVVDTLRRQNLQVGANGAITDKQSQSAFSAPSRLKSPKDFESVILRVTADGQVIRLKEVAQVELNMPAAVGFARVDGKPAALLDVTAWPKQVTADQLVNDTIADALAPGMKLISLADRSVDRLLSVEVRLPSGSTLEQAQKVVAKATELIRGLPGKSTVFAFADGREPSLAMIFIKVGAKDSPTAKDLEKALAGISGATIRTGDVPPSEAAFPARMALLDPGERGEEQFHEAAEHVLATLAKDKDLTGPAAFPLSLTAQSIIVDRDKCAKVGVELDDIFTTLQTSLGGVQAVDAIRFGKLCPVIVKTDPQFARFPEDLTKLMVRGAAGEMLPLDTLIKIRQSSAPAAVIRINGQRSIVITAASASGKSSNQVAAKCVKLAREVLPQGYRAIDLTGP
ncbi:MAG: efflux system, inner rane transporter CmeB [Schlesneria sp.]|nr:efflux system, inner rane transporter CmeB [Schlesneria sp.]